MATIMENVMTSQITLIIPHVPFIDFLWQLHTADSPLLSASPQYMECEFTEGNGLKIRIDKTKGPPRKVTFFLQHEDSRTVYRTEVLIQTFIEHTADRLSDLSIERGFSGLTLVEKLSEEGLENIKQIQYLLMDIHSYNVIARCRQVMPRFRSPWHNVNFDELHTEGEYFRFFKRMM